MPSTVLEGRSRGCFRMPRTESPLPRQESRQIDRLIDSLPEPLVGPQRREYSGKFNVRVPKSLHAALASEAEAEGVSLNQLVLAKLALHLQVR
jgi:predicted HicB family RNase H-like nuclease